MDGQLKIIKAKHISVLQRSIVLQCCDWLRGEDAQTRVQKRYCIFSGAKISREREMGCGEWWSEPVRTRTAGNSSLDL